MQTGAIKEKGNRALLILINKDNTVLRLCSHSIYILCDKRIPLLYFYHHMLKC